MAKCRTNKRRFRDELGAKIVLARLQRNDHGERRAYRCNHCSGWHLTSQPQRTAA